MKSIILGSISRKLALLVIFAVLPALVILIYTGMEQRHNAIEEAKQDILFLTHAMAGVQEDITTSAYQILSTLSLLPDIQYLDYMACNEIFSAVLERNPDFKNITLTDLDGNVMASGIPTTGVNLGDRKHFKMALEKKGFAVGEFILARVGGKVPSFAFANAVLDPSGRLKAVLTMAIKLSRFSSFVDVSDLPENAFVAATDYKGIRLFYYPTKETNPIGKPIRSQTWEKTRNSQESGSFVGVGTDNVRRMFAFEQVRLTGEAFPYMFVWAGIPEAHILKSANGALRRNLLILLAAALLSIIVAWVFARTTLVSPIKDLVAMTRQFADGNLKTRSRQAEKADEFGVLTRSFHEMAEALEMNQNAIRDNETRFRLVMDSLDAVVYVADMQTYEVLFINQFARRVYGDVIGKRCWETIQGGQDGPCPFCSNPHLLDADGQPGETYSWDFQSTLNGNWYHIQDRAIHWVDGRIVRMEIATDISKRKLAESRLAEETERLKVTLSSIGDGVITTDVQGCVVLINHVAEKLTGWDSRQAAGRPLEEIFNIVNMSTGQPCKSPVEEILTSGEVVGLAKNTTLISKSGQKRGIDDSGAPIRDKDGKIIGVVLVFRDVTEQLRMEQELAKTKKLESIGVLAGGIAHDFNNILVAILGNIEVALLDEGMPDKSVERLEDAVKASRQARDLTHQLLTFAKGGQPIKETVSLVDVIRDSAGFVLRGDNVSISYLFEDELCMVDIDKGQISQVIQNIVLNATQAMPDGGAVEVTCENINSAELKKIDLPQKGDYVKMNIKDNGAGMPTDVLERIFDPYFSTKKKGSGLGLAIAHSIVSKHNGHISVQSTPGDGTVFTIYLPAPSKQPSKKRDTSSDVPRMKSSTIMVMDDEELVRGIVQAMLEKMGHSVLLVEDGAQAVRTYKEALDDGKRIDLTIMDLTIPGGMGGKEAVERILDIDAKAKVVVSSGYSNDPVMANFKAFGFCAAIAKPYEMSNLKQLIFQQMARYEQSAMG